MSILLPDAGLLFWMLIAFGIVFFILAKYGFPAITSMIDKRNSYINDSLKKAKEVNAKLENIKNECESLLKTAHEEQIKIMRETAVMREKLLSDARDKAEAEGRKMITEAKRVIEEEKYGAISDIRNKIAEISIAIAEKIIRKELSGDKEQNAYIDKMIEETITKKENK